MFDLNGRVALVTGAGQGVGTGIAEMLARAGARVVVNDLHTDRAVAAAEQTPGVELGLGFDVADIDAVRSAVDRIGREIGPIDVLVNNAGIPPTMGTTPFVDLTPEQWRPYVDVNLWGVANCTHATLPGMIERGFGRVIVISSGAGTTGLNIGVSMYGAGKAGALGLMRHLAVENGRKGVTVNALALGLMGKPDAEPTEVTAGMARQIPVGRLGLPADVGAACVWLASDEAEWVTGQTIHINGGSVTT